MSINTIASLPSLTFTVESIKDEIKALVERGSLSRRQTIYSLARYIPPREWLNMEKQLEQGDYLLRDHIADLLDTEKWDND